jgi:uncharacterized protein
VIKIEMKESDLLKTVFEAYSQGNFSAALNNAIPLAKDGLKEAQAFVGSCYQLGLGTEVNGNEAVFWYEKAAKQDEASACNNLAWIYELGILGIEKNLQKSEELKKKAIELGLAS